MTPVKAFFGCIFSGVTLSSWLMSVLLEEPLILIGGGAFAIAAAMLL